MKVFKYVFSLLLIPATFFPSCVDSDMSEVLDSSQTFRNVADANNSVKGLYAQVMDLAEQTVVLNELRADLMDVTVNADQDLQDISYLNSKPENPYASVVKYYKVVQSCNDMLYNFNKMLQESKIPVDQYDQVYSDVMTVRCWTYLQLGAIYGRIPYITDPIESISDLNVSESSYIGLDQLVPELVACMESLPTFEQYNTTSELLRSLAHNHNLAFYFLNKRCFLAELYLWDEQYLKAAQVIRDFHLLAETNISDSRYKNFTWVYQGSFVGAYMITYTRYLENDVNALINVWSNMFDYEMESSYANWEHITCMTFDKAYDPVYPFIRLFGTQGAGKYLLKPSDNAIDNYWGVQIQRNGFQFDGRGRNGSYFLDDQNRPVVTKYLYDYDLNKPYEQPGKWFIYRAGWLNLLYAEACNRYAEMGGYVNGDILKPVSSYRTLTRAFLNDGVSATYRFRKPNGTSYPGDSLAMSGWTGGSYFPYPFNFDARMLDVPYHRGTWRSHGGTRGRVSLANIAYDTLATTQPEVRFWEKAILDELGLETAFEGHRWTDLIRIARRWNKETPGAGTALLNQVIGAKFDKNGKSFTPFVDDESNWYLPAKFQ